MAGTARHQGRTDPRFGPSDTSDTISDRPQASATDSDSGGTGERVTVGVLPQGGPSEERDTDRVVGASEAGLGGGLDQAEEARLGKTDEEIERDAKEGAWPFPPEKGS